MVRALMAAKEPGQIRCDEDGEKRYHQDEGIELHYPGYGVSGEGRTGTSGFVRFFTL